MSFVKLLERGNRVSLPLVQVKHVDSELYALLKAEAKRYHLSIGMLLNEILAERYAGVGSVEASPVDVKSVEVNPVEANPVEAKPVVFDEEVEVFDDAREA